MEKTPFPLIFILWGAGLGAAAQYGKVSVIFDLLPQAYPDAGAMVGWIVSLVGFVGIIFGVMAGLLVARIRYRRALIWALWLGAAVSVVQAFMPSLPLMLLSRVVEGASHLAIVVATPTLIAQMSAPRHRGFTLTLWGTFFGVAFAVLTFAGRPFALAYGLPALFFAHGVYMAIFAAIIMRWQDALPDETRQPAFRLVDMLREHMVIYRSPYLAAAAAGWLFYTFSFVSILTVLPPYIDPSLRVAVMTAMPLMSILVSLTLGVALLRVASAVRVVELGFVGSAASMVWLWVVPGDPMACLVLASAMGLIQGASFAAVAQLNDAPAAQSQANGAMAQAGNIGNTLGTPVMAFALSLWGYAALPLLAGMAFVLGFGAHIALGRLRVRS